VDKETNTESLAQSSAVVRPKDKRAANPPQTQFVRGSTIIRSKTFSPGPQSQYVCRVRKMQSWIYKILLFINESLSFLLSPDAASFSSPLTSEVSVFLGGSVCCSLYKTWKFCLHHSLHCDVAANVSMYLHVWWKMFFHFHFSAESQWQWQFNAIQKNPLCSKCDGETKRQSETGKSITACFLPGTDVYGKEVKTV